MLELLLATGFLMVLMALTYVKEKIGRDRLFHSNLDYILLGLLLSLLLHSFLENKPDINADTWVSVATLLYGIIFGSRFNFRNFLDKNSDEWKMVYFPFAFGGILVLLAWLILDYGFGIRNPQWLAIIITIVLIMISNSRELVTALLKTRVEAPADLIRQFNVLTISMDVIAITIFGIVIAYFIPDMSSTLGFRPLEWIVINILVGLAGGALAVVMLGREPNDYNLAVVLVSHILVLAVASIYFKFSPLFTGMIWSSVILNFYKDHEQFTTFLYRFEKPVFSFVYVAAGFLVAPWALVWAIPLAVVYVAIRLALKYFSARQAFYSSDNPLYWTDSIGMMLMGQGGLALAISINLVFILDTEQAQVIHAIVVLGVLAFQIFGFRLIRNYLNTYITR